MHWKGYLPIYINQFRSYQPIYIDTTRHASDTTRHHQTCSRHHQTPPDTHQTIFDRLAVVLCWFIELYSWSRFFAPTDGWTNEGVPRGPRGPKKVLSHSKDILRHLINVCTIDEAVLDLLNLNQKGPWQFCCLAVTKVFGKFPWYICNRLTKCLTHSKIHQAPQRTQTL